MDSLYSKWRSSTVRPFLKSRLIPFIAASVIILGAAVFTTYYAMSFVAVTSRDYLFLSQDLDVLTQLQLTVQRSLMPANDYLIYPDSKLKLIFMDLSSRVERLLDDLEAQHKNRASMLGARTPEQHQAYIEKDLATFREVRDDFGQLRSLAHKIFSLSDQAVSRGEGVDLMIRMDQIGERTTTSLGDTIDYHHKEMDVDWKAMEEANRRAKVILLLSVGMASLLAIILTGLVIVHANVLSQSIVRRDQLNSLYEAGQDLTSLVDRDQLMPWIANTAAQLMRADAAGFHLLDGGRLVVGYCSEGSEEALYSEIPLDMASPWRKIINSNEPHLSTKAGLKSFLGVPLSVKDKAIGVLSAFRLNPQDFEAGEVEVFGAFADQAAVALENVRLIESLKSTQHQLLQSEKMAGLGQFIAGMAHEVGTPLNIISGNAEYLMEVVGNEVDAKEELQVIIQQTERIARLIQQLLDFSRPHQAVVKESLQINDIINKVIGLIGLQAAKNNIEISTAFQADMPSLVGSADLLQQVFLNISLNAFHAMPSGGRLIIITQTGSRELGLDAEPEWVEVIIRDTGGGIEPYDLQKIFDPFFSTKPSGEGTGLGLYVSYQIINNFGGEIQVESQVGKGTIVRIIVPITHDVEAELHK
jgi:signal transduction histidine kinase